VAKSFSAESYCGWHSLDTTDQHQITIATSSTTTTENKMPINDQLCTIIKYDSSQPVSASKQQAPNAIQ